MLPSTRSPSQQSARIRQSIRPALLFAKPQCRRDRPERQAVALALQEKTRAPSEPTTSTKVVPRTESKAEACEDVDVQFNQVNATLEDPTPSPSSPAQALAEPPAPIHDVKSAPQEARPTRRRLGSRLFTSGGWARTHAISAGALLLYSMPCTLWLWWRAAHGESLTPSGAELLAVIVLSYVKDVTAVPLALRHRRGAEQEAMLIASFVDAAVWTFTLYLCAPVITESCGIAVPPLPEAARTAIYGTLVLGGVVSTLRPILTATELVASTNKTGTRGAAAAAAAAVKAAPAAPAGGATPQRSLLSGDSATAGLYGLVQVIPGWSVIVGAGTVLFGGPEMREWMVTIMPTGYGLFYGTAFCGAAAGSLGVFSATLYSRRVISAAQLSALNAAQISVYLGFLLSVYNADPNTYGEVLRVTQLQPFWLFNEAPWL